MVKWTRFVGFALRIIVYKKQVKNARKNITPNLTKGYPSLSKFYDKFDTTEDIYVVR